MADPHRNMPEPAETNGKKLRSSGRQANGETTEAGTETERAKERQEEDESYVPVIVKRTDEAVRHPDDILEKAIVEGLEQLNRPFLSLSLSSVAAGLILGFTAMAVAIVASDLTAPEGALINRLATGLVYPLGFVLCIMSGTQLFTEHTATAVYPVLDKKAGLAHLFRLWLTVIVGNLVGAFCSASLLTLANSVILARDGFFFIAAHLVGYDAVNIVISALLAGWLMALGGWLVLATPPTLSQIVCIYIVTFLIGLGGLHHSIAGAVEIFTAVLLGDRYSFAQAFRFIGLAICGNLVGGSVFVAVLNYGHIRKTRMVSTRE